MGVPISTIITGDWSQCALTIYVPYVPCIRKKKRSVPLKRPCAAYYKIVSQTLALPCAVSTGDVQGISETTKASPERSDS